MDIENEKNIKEDLLSPVSIEGTNKILNQMKNCICKIYIDNGKVITGFFMKVPYKSINLSFLITNNMLLKQKKFTNKNIIEFTINDDKIYKKIELNQNRKIIEYSELNLAFIEIYPFENRLENYLELDTDIIEKNNKLYKNKSIYTLYYPKNKNIIVSYGLLFDIVDNNIIHKCNIEDNSFGIPILSLDNFKVIGINKKNLNIGINIKYIIQEFIKKYNENKEAKNEIKNKINEFNIIYSINKNDKQIKIFDETFVNNNKNNCKIIFLGNEIQLTDYIDISKIKGNYKTLEIKLIEIKTISNMSNMFYNCKSLLSFPELSKWDTSNVSNISCMFYNCTSLAYIPDISKWNTSNMKDISCMFYNCSSLCSLPDISKWNTINIKYMFNLFDGCSLLLSLPDISKWNTVNCTEMASMFRMCSSLTFLPDISKWNINNVVNLAEMFNGCKLLSSLPDISKWNTNKVINMIGMFAECTSLVFLPDISKWDTGRVWNMNGMFYKCTALSYFPDISNWNTNKVTKKAGIFKECYNLIMIPSKFKNT